MAARLRHRRGALPPLQQQLPPRSQQRGLWPVPRRRTAAARGATASAACASRCTASALRQVRKPAGHARQWTATECITEHKVGKEVPS